MKQILILLISASLFQINALNASSTKAPKAESTWLVDFEKAKEKAKAQNKHILVDFTGSDWCGWCIKLKKEVFDKSAFKNYAKENLILVELDFPQGKKQSSKIKKQNERLAQKYGIRGFPTILVMDPNAKVIQKTGYQRGGPEAYVTHIKEIIASAK